MVIDAIGEFDTASIWHWKKGKLKKIHSTKNFPSSLGLFYSSDWPCRLKAMEDEYVLMGMHAYGDPIYETAMNNEFFVDPDCVQK